MIFTSRLAKLMATVASSISLIGCALPPLSTQPYRESSFVVPEPIAFQSRTQSVWVEGGTALYPKGDVSSELLHLGVYGNLDKETGPERVVAIAGGLRYVNAWVNSRESLILQLSTGQSATLYNANIVACRSAPVGVADAQAAGCMRVKRLKSQQSYLFSSEPAWREYDAFTSNRDSGWTRSSSLFASNSQDKEGSVLVGSLAKAEYERRKEAHVHARALASIESKSRDARTEKLRAERDAALRASLRKPPVGTRTYCTHSGLVPPGTALHDGFTFRCSDVGEALLGDFKEAGWTVHKAERSGMTTNTGDVGVSWLVELQRTTRGK